MQLSDRPVRGDCAHRKAGPGTRVLHGSLTQSFDKPLNKDFGPPWDAGSRVLTPGGGPGFQPGQQATQASRQVREGEGTVLGRAGRAGCPQATVSPRGPFPLGILSLKEGILPSFPFP